MKKIDWLITKNFFGPFIVTFMISLFVLIMQTMWLYIDEIMGKGVGILKITELIAYNSVTLFPMALPLAVLISSVMVFGNFAERFELSSMKATGISLLRIFRPGFGFVGLVAIFSFFTSISLIPKVSYKFKTILREIRLQKASFSLSEGEFNDDFAPIIIYVEEKAQNGIDLKNILIYDNSTPDVLIGVKAKSGKMYNANGGDYMVMELEDGMRYEEVKKGHSRNSQSYMRSKFEKYRMSFDLTSFDLDVSSEDTYKDNPASLPFGVLTGKIDTLSIKLEEDDKKQADGFLSRFFIMQSDSMRILAENKAMLKKDKTPLIGDEIPKFKGKNKQKITTPIKSNAYVQEWKKPLSEVVDFAEGFKKHERSRVYSIARSNARSVKNSNTTARSRSHNNKKRRVKYLMEWHRKFSIPLTCIIFLFIGAPMGAIVRKGGFGFPILIAIIFFVSYISLTILFTKLAESFVIYPWVGAWAPNMILAVIALLVTTLAMQDSISLSFNIDFSRIKQIFKKNGNN